MDQVEGPVAGWSVANMRVIKQSGVVGVLEAKSRVWGEMRLERKIVARLYRLL